MAKVMQANELRIGNWINQGTQYGLEKCTAYEIYNFALMKRGGYVADYYHEWQPILLTPEILEKAGFVHHLSQSDDEDVTDSEWWTIRAGKGLWGKFEICIVKFEEGLTYSCHDTRSQCKYVHQLQNLYFALTGEELQVEL